MNKKNIKHLSFDDRLEIEKGLKEGLSFKQIAENIGKHCTTIPKEIKSHYITSNTGAVGRPFFDCKYRHNCPFKKKGVKCNPKLCNHYEKEECKKLKFPPYVCNGCKNKLCCTLTKRIYEAEKAYSEYKEINVDSKKGTTFTEEELNNIVKIIKPLILNGHSIHSAIESNKDSIMVSERTIYELIEKEYIDIKSIDLPRKVRYKTRKKDVRKNYYKVDKQCLEGRRYQDFLDYIEKYPDTSIVEMDSVEGTKGGKVFLTLHFINCSFMLCFIRDTNDAKSVIEIFNTLEEILGLDKFKELFPIILTDNGSEFSNPKEIEFNKDGNRRTTIFYCEPNRPDQKGHCENNHEFIRRILPKKTSFNNLTQQDCNLMMSHINSYKRKKLNDCSPTAMFSIMYGKDTVDKLGIVLINDTNINLTPNLLK